MGGGGGGGEGGRSLQPDVSFCLQVDGPITAGEGGGGGGGGGGVKSEVYVYEQLKKQKENALFNKLQWNLFMTNI